MGKSLKMDSKKSFIYAGALAVLLLLNMCTTCSTGKRVMKLEKRIDTLENSVATKKDLQIEGLRSSKRTLYDWNSVVRTTVRPDDRMNQYDQEIKELETK
jgi:hypothetical protein